jgi:hypothetical protein
MKMIQHGLGPGMKHTYEPGLALKPPLGITGEYFDHLTDRRKQQVQQRSHIAEDDRVQVMGQRKPWLPTRTSGAFRNCWGTAVSEPP